MNLILGSILGYALIVVLGGIVGYAKAKSQVSLLSGLGSGIVLAIAGYTSLHNVTIGLGTATLVSLLLLVVFSIRFRRTQAFMPAGLMAILSLMAAVVYLSAWMWTSSTSSAS